MNGQMTDYEKQRIITIVQGMSIDEKMLVFDTLMKDQVIVQRLLSKENLINSDNLDASWFLNKQEPLIKKIKRGGNYFEKRSSFYHKVES